jgi:hypothetical protein
MYNLNYTPTTLGYNVEEKLFLAVREQQRLNTTAIWQANFANKQRSLGRSV